MIYRVVVTNPAQRCLSRLPAKVHLAIAEFINGPLAENPHRVGKMLRDDPTKRYTARVGVHRIIYRIDDKIRVISVGGSVTGQTSIDPDCRREAESGPRSGP